MPDAIAELQKFIDDEVAKKSVVRLLEAGCGSASKIRWSEKFDITGIDISQAQLARNAQVNTKIVGDIQSYKFEKQSFDMIVCWEVLEHLDHPELALRNFFEAVKPDGLVIVAYPNLYSLKGVITKFTPHFVHVWYYRYLLRRPEAGKNDTVPFVAPFRLSATYPAIRRLASSYNAREVFFALRESYSMQYVRNNFRTIGAAMKATSLVSRALTFGKVDAILSDCIQVFRAGQVSAATQFSTH